eukprot:6128449-Lingulodinium_polyedra.AAC.1
MLAGVHGADPVLIQPARRTPHDDHGPVHRRVARRVQPMGAGGPGVLGLLPVEGPLADGAIGELIARRWRRRRPLPQAA